jgi:hypothetical protein
MVRLIFPARFIPEVSRPYIGAAGNFGKGNHRKTPKTGTSGNFGKGETHESH